MSAALLLSADLETRSDWTQWAEVCPSLDSGEHRKQQLTITILLDLWFLYPMQISLLLYKYKLSNCKLNNNIYIIIIIIDNNKYTIII